MAQYTCIVCPNSCLITVEEGENGLKITGNQCKRGEAFAKSEHEHPLRMFTSTVKIEGARLPRLSVVTSGEIPKEKLFECQKALNHVVAHAPVSCGDALVKDFCHTGVDLLASRSMK